MTEPLSDKCASQGLDSPLGSTLEGIEPLFAPAESEFNYRLLFENNPIPMWVIDPVRLCFLAVNQASLRQYGYTRQEFLTISLAEISCPESVAEMRDVVACLEDGADERSGTLLLRRKDGSEFDVEIACSSLDFPDRKAVLVVVRDLAVQKQAERAAREAQEKALAIFDDAVIGVFRVTPDGRPISVNHALAQIHGYLTPEELLKDVENVATDLFVDPQHLFELHRASQNGIVRNVEVEVFRKDRSRRWMKVNLRTARDASGGIQAIEGTTEDITERKRAEEALLFKTALLEAQSETTLDGILAVDESNRVVLMNRQFKAQFSVPDQLLQSGEDSPLLNHVLDRVEDPTSFLEQVKYLYRNPGLSSTDELRLRNGRTFERYSAPLEDSRGEHRGRIWYFRDITERKAAEEQVKFLAYYDSLTGLPNRTLLMDRLENALAGARRRSESVAVLFMDLDRFKVINDSLGHSVGDGLLKEIGVKLRGIVREQDTVARVGGDEFVVVLNAVRNELDVAATAARIVNLMTKETLVEDRPLNTSCSLGISMFPQNSGESETLIKYADQAMYCAKENGRNSFQFFTSAMNTQAVERLRLERDLRTALETDQFFLLYQPQVKILTREITGFEALIRWRHPRLGIVSPADFIPVAENCGLIVPIGEWVLKTACAQVREWQDAGFQIVPIAVNVSAAQFRQEAFCALVKRLLQEARISPRNIELEITEGLLLSNFDVLRELKQTGVQLAIDDFGTGYSSLSYLKRLQVDKIKIDQTFIHDLATDRDDAMITSAIIGLGKNLNLTVVAEGVEEEAQVAILRNYSCDEAQGYYYSKPLSSREARGQLKKRFALESPRLSDAQESDVRRCIVLAE